jgi:hypothetical protein
MRFGEDSVGNCSIEVGEVFTIQITDEVRCAEFEGFSVSVHGSSVARARGLIKNERL